MKIEEIIAGLFFCSAGIVAVLVAAIGVLMLRVSDLTDRVKRLESKE